MASILFVWEIHAKILLLKIKTMKKTILSFALLLYLTAAVAECRKDTIYFTQKYDNALNGKQKYVNEYNSENKIINTIKYNWVENKGQFFLSTKDSTTYNSNGDETELLTQFWYTTYWKPTSRIRKVYDANFNLIENVKESGDGNFWNRETISRYKYDAQNRMTENFYSAYNTGTRFTDSFKIIYTYSNFNKILTESHFRIDVSHPTWTNELLVNYSYNGDNLLTETIKQNWDNSAWVNFSKTTYEYNGNKQLYIEMPYNWNKTSSAWENRIRYISTYNPAGFETEKTQQLYNAASKTWEDFRGTKTTYNGNNQPLSIVEREMNGVNWKDKIKTINQYNSNGQITLTENSIFTLSNVWRTDKRQTYEYDASQDLQVYNEYTAGFNTDSLIVHHREEYKCTHLEISSISNIDKRSTAIYPNPVTENIITINVMENTNFILFESMGKTIMKVQLIVGNNTLTLPDNISNGIYFIQIGNSTQKIILNK